MNQDLETEATISLFDITFQNVTREQAVTQIINEAGVRPLTPVFFVNAHCINVSSNDPDYWQLIHNAPLVYADGVGMKLAARWAGTPLMDNVNGTDLFPHLCDRLQQTDHALFLLGGEPGVAEELRRKLETQYPKLTLSGTRHGHFSDDDNQKVINQINQSNTDILLVAMGVPKQEKWITEFAPKTGARVAVGVGGLFNFYSGRIPRAPKWMRASGLEWLHRFIQEPGRLWRRYFIGNLVFILRVFFQRKK